MNNDDLHITYEIEMNKYPKFNEFHHFSRFYEELEQCKEELIKIIKICINNLNSKKNILQKYYSKKIKFIY